MNNSGTLILKQEDRPRKRRKKDLITQAQAEKAAEQCGLSVLKIGYLKEKARLGKYIDQLGATHIGRSALLVNAHQIDDAVAKIDIFIQQQDGGDLCLQMDLFKLKAAYLDLSIRNAKEQMKAPRQEAMQDSGPAPVVMCFPPGTQMIAAKVPEKALSAPANEVTSEANK